MLVLYVLKASVQIRVPLSYCHRPITTKLLCWYYLFHFWCFATGKLLKQEEVQDSIKEKIDRQTGMLDLTSARANFQDKLIASA